ncbi:MAG: DUF2177 family protein [Thermodesulfobacteriota bacterium]|nr:DUF2177 family protein [Thermodesulfobacteriota bacterium]
MHYFFSASFLKVAVLSIVIFIVLDLVWLSVVARKIYFNNFSYLAVVENDRIVFNLPVGLGVQAIIALGLAVFVSLGIMADHTLLSAVGTGAFAGFVLYCTYDLTNLSFVRDYPVFITMVDIAWGTAQGVFAGIYVYFLTNWLAS